MTRRALHTHIYSALSKIIYIGDTLAFIFLILYLCYSLKSSHSDVNLLSAECGGHITADYGQIKSPGYPGNYAHSRNCVWTISVTPGNSIQFTFGEIRIETHETCNYDYLKVSLIPSLRMVLRWRDSVDMQCAFYLRSCFRSWSNFAWRRTFTKFW